MIVCLRTIAVRLTNATATWPGSPKAGAVREAHGILFPANSRVSATSGGSHSRPSRSIWSAWGLAVEGASQAG
jgi:hypothetical protein